jgi:3-hydroxyacyl-CoA dehydrogenase
VSEILRVACVGAGLIGQGWATVFASRGLTVVLQDLTEAVLDEALSRIAANLRFLETHRLLEKCSAERATALIDTTTRIEEAVARVDYVQESVPERYEIKKQVFKIIDKVTPPGTILASSSSGLLMSEIQKATSRPERCVMAHPMLPVHLVPAVEVVGGKRTSPDATLAVCEFMKKMGKVPVLLKKEVSGYIVNRLQAALLREAIDLVDKGVANAEDVDRAFCMGIGLRDPVIGPFLRAHLAGEGIERFLENYAESYRLRWESMETWTSVPSSAAQAVVKSVKEMNAVKSLGLEELKIWRDEMLVKIVHVLKEKQRRAGVRADRSNCEGDNDIGLGG